MTVWRFLLFAAAALAGARASGGESSPSSVSADDVIPLELLPPPTAATLLSGASAETQQSEASTFGKAGSVRVFAVDVSALCNATFCYSHHWSLFARLVPSAKAFLAANASVVRFVTSLGDAALIAAAANDSAMPAVPLGVALNGHTAQIAPYALEARPYFVVVRTPRSGEFADVNAERLHNAPYRLVVTLVKAQLLEAGVSTRLVPLQFADYAMKRYLFYDRAPIDFLRIRRSDALSLAALVEPRAPPPALCWKLLDDGSRERCIADKYLNGVSESFVGSRFALCLAANLVHTNRQRSCRMAARRVGQLAARAVQSSEAHSACVAAACDDECAHGVVSELVVQLFVSVAQGGADSGGDGGSDGARGQSGGAAVEPLTAADETDADEAATEGAAAEKLGSVLTELSLKSNRALLASDDFLRGVSHICSSTGRRENGSFSCWQGAGAGLMRAAGSGARDGFGDVIAALKTCYGVMKTANERNLPHFGVELCGDGVFAEWLRVNAKQQLSFSAFGRDVGLMCRSRTRQLTDEKLFEHDEYNRCIAALGRQSALKSGLDVSRTVTLCNQLGVGDRDLCIEAGRNFTALHEDGKFFPLPECERSPANAPDFRSTVTLLATPLGDVPPVDVLRVDADWFDIVGYRAWQEGEFVDMLDPAHPAVYDDPDAPPVETSTDELQRPDGRRRRRRRRQEPLAPLNYNVTVAGSLVHSRVQRLAERELVFYLEWSAAGAALDIAFLLNDTLPSLSAELALERAASGGRWALATYILLGVGALAAAVLTYYQFWLRAKAGAFKSIHEEL